MNTYNLKLLTLMLFFTFSQIAYAQNDQEKMPKATIVVNIIGVKSSKGFLKGFLFENEDSFLKNTFKEVQINLENSDKTQLILEHIPFGAYAINIYQDVNKNNKLDTNLFGIPKEPYGFSNGIRGKMGPPNFTDVKVIVDSKLLEININIK